MSRVHSEDYFEGLDMCDPFRQLTKDLEDMDIPDNLNLENPGLMSSDFFDSVLSLEEQTANFENGGNSDDISSSNVDSDFGGLSSDPEELCLNYNCSPDSANSNFDYEMPDYASTNNNMDSEKNSKILLVKKPPQNTIGSKYQVPGKIIVNNPNGKKVIVTKPYAKNNRRNVANAKHIYKVQSISGNGRTFLLPFNVTKMKTIKIINGKELCAENTNIRKSTNASMFKYEDNYSVSSPDSVGDDSDSVDTKCQYPVLLLTEEEKRLLAKEGIPLPTHYPLTKNEEKELKRIRRKIRNKISAQDSRKRKKEYVDGLEERLKQSAEEKKILMNRVKALQQQNNRLVSQMNKLQSLVFNTNKVTPTTCLLIVLMSALLVSLPNLNISKGRSVKDEQQANARRMLLSSQRAINEDTGSLDEFLLFNTNQKPAITAFDDENIADEHSAFTYIHYDEYEHNNKKSFLETGDIVKDVQNTFEKMKDFFKNQFDTGHNYSEEKVVKNREGSRNFQKRLHFCPDICHDYVPAKISKMDEYSSEHYTAGELNTDPDSTSSVALHLVKQ